MDRDDTKQMLVAKVTIGNAKLTTVYAQASEEKDGTLLKTSSLFCFQFVNLYMRRDGVFLLQLIDVNVGGVFTAAIIDRLWDIYR